MKAKTDAKVAWSAKEIEGTPASARPFYTFILKVASRCNIDCDYCYVYHGNDQSWTRKPKVISDTTVQRFSQRVNEHALEHGLDEVAISFHGGEPLLVGSRRLAHYIEILKSEISCDLVLGMQTNAILLNKRFLDLFVAQDLKFGVSIDGNRQHNDRHRLKHDGTSSYDLARRGIELARSRPDWSRQFGGFLTVVDIANDPVEVLTALADLTPGSFELLLPHTNHDAPPHRPCGANAATAYGRWLADFFDAWYRGYPEISVTLFDNILALVLGGQSDSEALAAKCVDLIIVDTDGSIEGVDTLKTVGEFATSLQMNIAKNKFSDALSHPAVSSRMVGFDSLCSTCRDCERLNMCGGGYLPHRYSRENGFLNPSVYCRDLKYLFDHVEAVVEADLRS